MEFPDSFQPSSSRQIERFIENQRKAAITSDYYLTIVFGNSKKTMGTIAPQWFHRFP